MSTWLEHLLETRAAALAMDSADDRARLVELHAEEFPVAEVEIVLLESLNLLQRRGFVVSTVDVKQIALSMARNTRRAVLGALP